MVPAMAAPAQAPGPLEADRLAALRDAALSEARRLGCSDAELRVERVRSQRLALRDGRLEGAADDTEVGMGLRVVVDGAMGFAATVATAPADAAVWPPRPSTRPRTIARAGGGSAELAPADDQGSVSWTSRYDVDPTEVPLADKVATLSSWSERLLAAAGIDHVTATVLAVTEDKYLRRPVGHRSHPAPGPGPPGGRGGGPRRVRRLRDHANAWPLRPVGAGSTSRASVGTGTRSWRRCPSCWPRSCRAPSVEAGRYDLVIDPTNLWLTIHESIGHATELDRAMGLRGRLCRDLLRHLRPAGHPALRVGGDARDRRPHRPTTAWPRWPSTTKACRASPSTSSGTACWWATSSTGPSPRSSGLGASNGCAFADSPLHVPIQRMANVSLAAGGLRRARRPTISSPGSTTASTSSVTRAGPSTCSATTSSSPASASSASSGGRLSGQVKDVAYQATTTDFWGALEAVGGRSTYLLGGAFNCGKGQPGQVAPVSHGCPSVLVRDVNILNTREESGR